MPETIISQKLKQFIFEYVDSVELVDVLMLLRGSPEKWFSSSQVSNELRSHPKSILMRLEKLIELNLLECGNNKNLYKYNPKTNEDIELIDELSELYSNRRHYVFELIFSTSKSARKFANAFILNKKNKPDGESNG